MRIPDSNTREFDGKLGNVWWEAKAGRFWIDHATTEIKHRFNVTHLCCFKTMFFVYSEFDIIHERFVEQNSIKCYNISVLAGQ